MRALESFTWLNDRFEVNAGVGRMIDIIVNHHPKWHPDAAPPLKILFIINIRNLKSTLVLMAPGVYNWQKYKMYMRGLPRSVSYAVVALTSIPLMSNLSLYVAPFLKRKRIFSA